MKAKPVKVVNTGKTGQVATKQKQNTQKSVGMSSLDHKTMGSAMGILSKHHK